MNRIVAVWKRIVKLIGSLFVREIIVMPRLVCAVPIDPPTPEEEGIASVPGFTAQQRAALTTMRLVAHKKSVQSRARG